MPCNYPITGYRDRAGKITFPGEGIEALRPEGKRLAVPCGQCIGCRMDRASAWTTRLLHEAQITEEKGRGSAFITLTYDALHLPRDHGLNVEHWQDFARRTRHNLGPFRYFHCGEYGPETKRPHYHAILFGHDFSSDRIPIGKNHNGNETYISPTLTYLWGMGTAQLGKVEKASAAYVAKYCINKRGGMKHAAENLREYTRTQNGKTWQVRPEYATMSLKPGIGAHWYQKYGKDIHPSDETIVEGKHVKTPKFYDTLYEKDNPEGMQTIKEKRAREGRKNRENNSKGRREAREYILKRQEQESKKSI